MTPTYPERAASQDDALRRLLTEARDIAIVGASTEPWRPSYAIAGYLKRQGYRIWPVNPHEMGGELHGEPFHATLQDLPRSVDLVNVFRRSDALAGVVNEAIEVHAPAVWAQIGVHDPAAAPRAQAAGMVLVMNRCISIDHSRLGIPPRR
jgi:predicted CoA-binding protein